MARAPGPDWRYFVRVDVDNQAIALEAGHRTLLNLGLGQRISSGKAASFSPDGERVAWGNTEGSVMIADLHEMQSRLAKVGLSWVMPSSSFAAERTPTK